MGKALADFVAGIGVERSTIWIAVTLALEAQDGAVNILVHIVGRWNRRNLRNLKLFSQSLKHLAMA